MVSFEEFQDMMEEIVQTFPEDFFRELNGGVFARRYPKYHPESVDHDLFIMGEYSRQYHLGRFIVIYYGSFMQVYGHLSKEELRRPLRKVLLHEFRHHLESLAGEYDLEIEDAIEIAQYRERHGNGRDL